MEILKNVAGRCSAISIACLPVVVVAGEINWINSDVLYFVKMLCVIIFGVGVLLYIFWVLAVAWVKTNPEFQVLRMRPMEMDLSIELSRKLFPSIPTKRELKAIYKANNSICRIQFKKGSFFGIKFNKAKATGIFSAAPVNKIARRLLEKEELHGLRLTDKHIIKENRSYECLYIGVVGAIGFRAKRHLLEFIKEFIRLEFEKDVEIIFTRPTTKDGLRIAKKYGFTPVLGDVGHDELDRLYCLRKTDYQMLQDDVECLPKND